LFAQKVSSDHGNFFHLNLIKAEGYMNIVSRMKPRNWTDSLDKRLKRKIRHVARMGENRNAYRILVGNPEGERPLGRPRRRWVDNIKMDLREIEWDGTDWIDLAQDRD
jgi:hypothetical protein